MSHFADLPEFTDEGDRAENPTLDTFVRNICQQLFGKDCRIQDSLTIYIPEQNFYHGPFSAGGRIGGFIYFEDAHVGMVAVEENPGTGQVKYARFSDSPMPGQNHENN